LSLAGRLPVKKQQNATFSKQVLAMVITLVIWDFLLDNVFFDWQSIHRGHSPWAVPWAVLTFVPDVFLAWLYVRYVRHMDELERRMQLEACATAFLGGTLVTVFYAYLATGGAPRWDPMAVPGLLIGLWLLGLGQAKWRYR
jgi:hypothetical protein